MAFAADSAGGSHAGLSGLTPAQREQALARWQVLRAHLEDGCPLVRVAGEHGVPERTLGRWLPRPTGSGQGWLAADFSRVLERRKPRPDRTRALSRAQVEQLLTREDIGLRERTFWRMLYETAARSAEVLALNVEDLDLPNRQARVRRKGGAVDVIIWQTATARLLPRL